MKDTRQESNLCNGCTNSSTICLKYENGECHEQNLFEEQSSFEKSFEYAEVEVQKSIDSFYKQKPPSFTEFVMSLGELCASRVAMNWLN